MQFKNNWEETNQRWEAWWNHEKLERPIIRAYAKRDKNVCELLPELPFADEDDKYLNVEKNFAIARNMYAQYEPIAEAIPQNDYHLGAGSIALYLGTEPHFSWETVWYKPSIKTYEESMPFRFDENNAWWKKHIEITRQGMKLAEGTDMVSSLPDLCEGLDILSAMRDPQTFCYDFFDYPGELKESLDQVRAAYMQIYDAFAKVVRQPNGYICNAAFGLWGKGRTAKVQCDFNALMSPSQVQEYQIPDITAQCEWLDHSIYHLDGPDCAKHIDKILAVKALDCLQYTPGHRQPDMEKDYEWVYKKAIDAGKLAWVYAGGYTMDESMEHCKRLCKRYGKNNFYFLFDTMSRKDADRLLLAAEREW